MLPFNLYYGIVEDINDPDKKAKIKIRLLPEMETASTQDLPWYEPFLAGAVTTQTMKHDPLEVGSTVWCIVADETYRNGWYISGVFVNAYFNYTEIENSLNNISEANTGDYRDIKFTRYADGTIQFVNTQTKAVGIYHSTGSYIVFDTNGNLTAYAKGKINVYNDGNSLLIDDNPGIKLDPSTGSIELAGNTKSLVKYEDLVQILNMLIANLDTRIHIDPLSGFTGTVNVPQIYATFDPMHAMKEQNMKADQVKTK